MEALLDNPPGRPPDNPPMALITLLNAQLAFGHVALLDHTGFSLETNERGATLATIRALGGGFDARGTQPAGRSDQ